MLSATCLSASISVWLYCATAASYSSIATAQVGAQSAAFEKREVDRGSGTVDSAARGPKAQALHVERFQANERGEVYVRIEIRARRAHAGRGRFDAEAFGGDIGPAREQVRGQIGRERQRLIARGQSHLYIERCARSPPSSAAS